MFDDILNKDKELSRTELALIYTINILNELVDKEILENKVFEVSDEALELIKDFEPTKDELERCVLYLMSEESNDLEE